MIFKALLETRHAHKVTQLTLNRPNRLNAFNSHLYNQVGIALNRLSTDDDTRIIVLTGTGNTSCAGMDLKEINESKHGLQSIEASKVFMDALMQCSKIVVATAFGSVTGIGVTMLLHCDKVYCSASTTFHTPFWSVGIAPEFASSVLIPQLLGPDLAAEFLLRGSVVGARRMAIAGACEIVGRRKADGNEIIDIAVRECTGWSASANEDQWNAVLNSKRLIRAGLHDMMEAAREREFEQIRGDVSSGVTGRLVREKVSMMKSKL